LTQNRDDLKGRGRI